MSVAQDLLNSYSDLLKLKKQIDIFSDANSEDGEAEAEKIKKLIKGLAIDLDIHREFCQEYEGLEAGLLNRSFKVRCVATDILDRTLKIQPSCKKAASDVNKFKTNIKKVIDVLEIKPKQLELL